MAKEPPRATEQSTITMSDASKPNAKSKPGASWKQNEQHVLPKNRMRIVFPGLMLCIFLAALDQVCTNESSLDLVIFDADCLTCIYRHHGFDLLIMHFYFHRFTSHMQLHADHRCHSSPNHRFPAERREKLQLGWIVSHLILYPEVAFLVLNDYPTELIC